MTELQTLTSAKKVAGLKALLSKLNALSELSDALISAGVSLENTEMLSYAALALDKAGARMLIDVISIKKIEQYRYRSFRLVKVGSI